MVKTFVLIHQHYFKIKHLQNLLSQYSMKTVLKNGFYQMILILFFLSFTYEQSGLQWPLIRKIVSGNMPITSADFSPDGNFLAAASEDRSVQFWDTASWTVVRNYTSSAGIPLTVRFSKDNTKLAIGYNSSIIEVLRISDMQLIFSNTTRQQQILQVDWNEASDKLLSCGFNRTFIVWDAKTIPYTAIKQQYINDRVLSCKFDVNGRVVVGRNEGSGQFFGAAIVYQNSNYAEIMRVNTSLDMNCVDVKPDGNFLIGANQIGKAYQIEIATSNSIDLLTEKQMLSCAYSRQSDYFAFGNNVSKLFIFDASNNTQLPTKIDSTGQILHLVFTYDGSLLASTDTVGQIIIYKRLLCFSGFYLTGNLCQQCNSTISNCVTCLSSTNCLTCASTYQIAANGSLCNALTCFPECLVCLSKTSCSLCITGYFKNSTNACQSCSLISNCLNCSNSTNCTTCQPGYYTSSGLCLSCSLISNCLQCSSSSICTNCSRGYQVNGSSQCEIAIACNVANCDICQIINPNYCSNCSKAYSLTLSYQCIINPCTSPCQTCLTPLSSSVCISCVLGFYLNATAPNQGNCLACNSSIPGCAECSDQFNCISCLPGNYLSNGLCIQCRTSISNCTQCSSQTSCNLCDNGYSLDQNVCIFCFNHNQNCIQCTLSQCLSCATGYRLVNNDTTKCEIIPCIVQNCLDCLQTDISICSVCSYGYQVNSLGLCQTRCGDGIYVAIKQQCDDGNQFNMDGCSQSCIIQNGFQCDLPNPPMVPLSDCTYTSPISLIIKYVQKVPGANKVKSEMSISPLLKAFQTFNFSTLVSTDLPVSSYSFNYDKDSGILSMVLDYQESIQGVQATVTVSPPQLKIFRLTPSSTARIMMNSRDNTGLYIYSEQTYNLASAISAMATVIPVIAWILLTLSLFSGKLVGIQMLAVLQVSFIGLMTVSNMNPTLSALKNLFISNGFNKFLANPFTSQTVPQQMKGLGLNQSFLNDFNVGLAFIFLPLMVALIAWILSKTVFKESIQNGKQKEKHELMQRIYVQAAGEYTLMMLVINCYIISVSMALQFVYGFNQLEGIIGYISIPQCILMIVLLSVYFVLLVLKPNAFGQFKSQFDPNSKLSYYTYNYMILQRIIIGFVLTVAYFTPFILLVPIVIFLLQAVFFVIRKPYNKIRHSYRMLANNLICSTILSIYMYYSFDSQNSMTSQIGIYLPLVVIALLGASLILNGVYIIHIFVKWVRKQCIQSQQQKQSEFQMVNVKIDYPDMQQFAPTPIGNIGNQNDKSIIIKVQKLESKNCDDQIKQFSLQFDIGQGYLQHYDTDFEQKLAQQKDKVSATLTGLNQMKRKLNAQNIISDGQKNSYRDALLQQEI